MSALKTSDQSYLFLAFQRNKADVLPFHNQMDKLECLVSSFGKKWLGLPRCITNPALYEKGVLELPVSSLMEEFKCSKVRLEMTLMELDGCPNSPNLVNPKEVVLSCCDSAGKVCPQTSGHRQLHTAGERRLKNWGELTMLAQSNPFTV